MNADFRVLVADADKKNRRTVSNALKEAPFAIAVEECEDGTQGMLTFSVGLFDCAFLDLRLPPAGGLKVLGEARKTGVEVPIVLLGTVSTESVKDEVLETGGSDYLNRAALSPRALKEALQRLARRYRAQSRLVAMTSVAPIPMVEVDEKGQITYANPVAAELFPNIIELGPAHGMLKTWGNVTRAVLASERETISREVKVEGSRYHQTITKVPRQPLYHIYAIDIRLAEDHLIKAADYDELTKLPNCNLLMDRLGRTLAREKRHKEQLFAVFCLNLDDFDAINETHGVMQGDRLLKSIGDRLRSCVRYEDTVARLEGDEFALLIESPHGKDDVTIIAERVLKKLRRPHYVGGRTAHLTASIGIALSETGYSDPEHLLRDTAVAMKEAKLAGGNQYRYFQPAARTGELLRRDLRRPSNRDSLLLHYQPIISLRGGHLTGLNLLVRWQHPSGSLVEKEAFIKDAEETGALLDIERWILREAIQHRRAWRTRFPERQLPASFLCISEQTLFSETFRDIIRQSADHSDEESDIAELVFGIPTSIVMSDLDFESAAQIMASISSQGSRLSVDGLGRGTQLLGRLRQLPINFLSIDRDLVLEMASTDNLRISRSITELAKSLGLELLAKRIETQGQLEAAIKVECDHAQGQRFGEPLTPEQAAELIAASPRWSVG